MFIPARMYISHNIGSVYSFKRFKIFDNDDYDNFYCDVTEHMSLQRHLDEKVQLVCLESRLK